MLEQGMTKIFAYRKDGLAFIEIEDNAGTYNDRETSDELGIKIVDRRLKNLFGGNFGTTVTCVPNELTRVTIRIPLEDYTA
jgi:two-component system LytT family sensor kinase